MSEKEIPFGTGYLKYTIQNSSVTITAWNGMEGEIELPETIDDLPVTVIGKKAFLSKKHLRWVKTPDNLTEIQDWAFAYCDGLGQVELPKHQLIFGKSVFMNCGRLEVLKVKGETESVGRLLSTAVTALDAPYLLDVVEAGSRQWLSQFDARVLSILHKPDKEGYSKQVLCGEEDYGSTDYGAYISERRKEKVRLALVRLLCSEGLSKSLEQELKDYLLEHTKGCESEESWQVVLKEHGTDRAYYELFVNLGCVTDANREQMIEEIGEDYPEMKSYFLRLSGNKRSDEDFFSMLDL